MVRPRPTIDWPLLAAIALGVFVTSAMIKGLFER